VVNLDIMNWFRDRFLSPVDLVCLTCLCRYC